MSMAGRYNICMIVVATAMIVIGSIAVYDPSQLQAAFAQNSSNTTNPLSNSSMSLIPTAYPPDAIQYNQTYGEWTAKWWQWLSSVPQDRNPAADETGANCHEGQNGPVWFLAGTYGGLNERVCSIPAEKSILFPVVNQLCTFLDRPNLRTESELRDCAVTANEGVTELMVIIDGQPISEEQLRTYRVQSPLFELNLPEGNFLSGQQGSTQGVSDGFWVFLPPLAPGAHEIHFRGTIVDFTTVSQNNFVTEALYHITVVG